MLVDFDFFQKFSHLGGTAWTKNLRAVSFYFFFYLFQGNIAEAQSSAIDVVFDFIPVEGIKIVQFINGERINIFKNILGCVSQKVI